MKYRGPELTTPLLDMGNPKTARERLCTLQSTFIHDRVADTFYGGMDETDDQMVAWINLLINQIDVIRPLGRDGRHGNLHTEFCGCDNKGTPVCKWCRLPVYKDEVWSEWRHQKNSQPECSGAFRRYRTAVPVWF